MNRNAESIPSRDRVVARSLRRALALALLMLWATASRASDIAVSVQNDDGLYQVRGHFETAARLELVWKVLTDYEHIPSFVESVKHSDVEERDGARVKVRQTAAIGVFPLRRRVRVTLDVREHPQRRIEFRDLLGHDFRLYHGSWSLRGDSVSTVVEYALDATPRSAAPQWIGRSMMSHSAQDLLQQVRDEIERRSRAR